MAIEQTVCLIKPEAMRQRLSISAILADDGFTLERATQIKISDQSEAARIAREMYPDASPAVIHITATRLISGPMVALLLSRENAIERLRILAGEATDPSQCAETSLRGRFGRKEPIRILADGTHFFANGVHRPKDAAEAARDIALFFK